MSMATEDEKQGRKRTTDEAELEIDVNAPEPPSKKALRKAKRQKTGVTSTNPTTTTTSSSSSDAVPSSNSGIHAQPPGNEIDLKRLNGLEGERSKFGVWIGNLAFTVGKKDLYKFLTENSKTPIPGDQITRLHLPSGRDARSQNKGFAYVDFKEQQWVESAVKLSETLLTGRPLLIKDAHNFEGRPETSKTKAFVESQARPPNRKLFVGNLSFDTTKETLERHFGVCGAIQKIQVATFEDSGKCKGYAWVEFDALEAAETAMRGQVTIDHPKSPTGKKTIYLGRLGDNKLRMEYAEDATTRYNKRYGRSAAVTTSEQEARTDGAEEGQEGQAGAAYGPYGRRGQQQRASPRKSQRDSRPPAKSRAPDTSRYAAETVQKLTGAIVEAQGKKVTFD